MSPPLQETLAALHASQASLADVREVLRESDVLVSKPADAASSEESVALAVVDYEGVSTVPLFSSRETFSAAARDGATYLEVPFEGLLPGWPDGIGAVFDLGQPWALHVSSLAMKEPAPLQAPAGSIVAVGEPVDEPAALLERLAHELRTLPEVQSAWRALVMLAGDGDTHLAIGLGLVDGGDAPAALAGAAEFVAAAVDGPFDLLVVAPDSSDPVAEYMLAREPFYRRGTG